MTLQQTFCYGQRGPFYGDSLSCNNRNYETSTSTTVTTAYNNYHNSEFGYMRNYGDPREFSRNCREYNYNYNYNGYTKPEGFHSFKRRKFSNSTWEDTGRSDQQHYGYDKVPSKRPSMCGNLSSNECTLYSNAPSTYADRLAIAPTSWSDANAHNTSSSKRDRSMFEDGNDVQFMSRDEIERFSPSRKDGIDAMHETRLRYSYCAFLQSLGLQLEL